MNVTNVTKYDRNRKYAEAIGVLITKLTSVENEMKMLAFQICNHDISNIKPNIFPNMMMSEIDILRTDYREKQKVRLSLIETIDFLIKSQEENSDTDSETC